MRAVRLAYYAFFTAIYDALRVVVLFDKERSSLAWTAVAVLSTLQGLVLASLRHWAHVYGVFELFLVTRGEAWALALGLLALNYLATLHFGSWEAYLRGFRACPEGRQRRVKWLARLAVVLVIACCGYSYAHLIRMARAAR